jgi:hypothetical protein
MGINYSNRSTPRLDLGEAFKEYEAEAGIFIAESVLAPFDSQKREASFALRKRASSMQNVSTKRASRGTFNRIDSRAGETSFACDTHGLEGVVDDEERQLYASDFDAELATVEDVAMALKIAKEIRVATAIFNTTTWTGSTLYTDVSAAPWDTAASDVIGPVLDAKEKVRTLTGMRANALILTEKQANNLLKNTNIIARFPGAALVTLDMIREALPKLFGLQYLFVGGGVYDAAAEGATTPTVTDIWSDDYAMVCRVATAGARLSTPSIGRTIRWANFDPGMAVQMYREEQTMGDVVRVLECVDELVIDASFGHLLKID